nr:MAG TPA: hypothetical protein [Caudoviricetes sp.]
MKKLGFKPFFHTLDCKSYEHKCNIFAQFLPNFFHVIFLLFSFI